MTPAFRNPVRVRTSIAISAGHKPTRATADFVGYTGERIRSRVWHKQTVSKTSGTVTPANWWTSDSLIAEEDQFEFWLPRPAHASLGPVFGNLIPGLRGLSAHFVDCEWPRPFKRECQQRDEVQEIKFIAYWAKRHA
jgi:hypothetical protein